MTTVIVPLPAFPSRVNHSRVSTPRRHLTGVIWLSIVLTLGALLLSACTEPRTVVINGGPSSSVTAGPFTTTPVTTSPVTTSPVTTSPVTASPTSVALSDTGPPDSEGVHCEQLPNPEVLIRSIVAQDGRPGISAKDTVALDVLQPLQPGHTYWLVEHLLAFDHPYKVLDKVTGGPGQTSIELLFPKSSVGTAREVYIMEGDPTETIGLENNFNAPSDNDRLAPPPGRIVSANCRVTKTRP